MEILELLNGGPAVLVSGATLAFLVAFITGQLKSVLRPIFLRLLGDTPHPSEEDPWGLVAVVLGIVFAFLVASSALAPAWLNDPAITVIYGVVIGLTASQGRDVLVRELLRR